MSNNSFSNNIKAKFWAVVPAAGVGARMAADCPKQYLQLQQQTILAHTISRLSQHPLVTTIVVAVSANDAYWNDVKGTLSANVISVVGGKERCHSVFNALEYILSQANPNDWALVHDAARPCVRLNDIDKLIQQVSPLSQGGLLGLPVSDTLKYCPNHNQIDHTVSREHLWRALTPQLFPVATLHAALSSAITQRLTVTDEASAMEFAGYRPRMIEGSADNIKITYPQDLALAEQYLQWQQDEGTT